MQAVIDNYLFTEREPLTGDIINLLEKKPTALFRIPVAKRIIDRMKDFVSTFFDGVGV